MVTDTTSSKENDSGNSMGINGTLIFSYGYFLIGVLSIIFNSVILFVYFRHRFLFKTGALVIGLCIGDIIYCMGHVTSGVNRISALTEPGVQSIDDVPLLQTWECTWRGPLFWLLGAMIQSLIILAMSIDRLVAVACYVWYFNNRTGNPRRQWTSVAILFGFSLVSSITVWCTLELTKEVPALCYPDSYMSFAHSYYHYSSNAIAGILSSTIGILVALVYLSRRKSLSTAGSSPSTINVNACPTVVHDAKEVRLSITMLVIGFFDMIMVVIPHVLLTAIKMGGFGQETATHLNYAAGGLIGFRSMISIFIYFSLNTDFRMAMLRMLLSRRSSITPQ